MVYNLKELKEEVNKITNNEYDVLEEKRERSKNGRMNHRFLYIHNKCGHKYWGSSNRFLKEGYRCVMCSKKRPFINTEIFKKRLLEARGDEFELVDEYINAYTKVKFIHKKCNREFLAAPKHLLNDNQNCTYCATELKMLKDYDKRILKQSFNNIELIKYNGFNRLCTFHCKKCNTYFEHKPCNFDREFKDKSICTCKICEKSSKGELMISYILKELNLKFIQQHSFSNCRSKKPLRFDFFVENEVLIEFDGRQHVDKYSHFASDFEDLQKRDTIKNNFCKENNIPLLRVSSYSYNKIRKQIIDFLKETKIIQN